MHQTHLQLQHVCSCLHALCEQLPGLHLGPVLGGVQGEGETVVHNLVSIGTVDLMGMEGREGGREEGWDGRVGWKGGRKGGMEGREGGRKGGKS